MSRLARRWRARAFGLAVHLTLAFGGLSIAATAAVTLLFSRVATEHATEESGRRAAELAIQMRDKLDRGMFERWRDIKVAASLPSIRNPHTALDTKRSVLADLQRTYPLWAILAFISPEGRILATSNRLIEGADVSQREFFLGGRQAPFVGDLHDAILLAKLLGRQGTDVPRFVDFSAPVRADDGSLIGVVAAHLYWEWATELETSLLEPLKGRSEAEIIVTARDGTVLLGPESLKRQKLTLASLAEARAGNNGYRSEKWPDGITYLTGFDRSREYRDYPGLGWLVLTRTREDVALAPVHALQNQILVLGAIAAAISIVLAMWMARRLSRPLRLLTESARRAHHSAAEELPRIRGYAEISSLSLSLRGLLNERTRRERSLSQARDDAQGAQMEARAAEQETRRTQEFLDAVIENLPMMLFVKEAKDHRFVLINRAGEELLGLSRDQLIGKNDHDFFPPQQADFFVARDREILASGELQVIIEEPVQTVHNGTRLLTTKKIALRDENGEARYLVGMSEDLTDRKSLERQLLQAQKMEAVGQLTGGLSHDFNNLLGIIIGNLDLLAGAIDDNEPALELQREALDAALRGADLNRSLLAFARRQPLQPKIVQLSEYIGSTARLLTRTLGGQVEVAVEMPPKLWPVRVDQAQLEAALTNLALNARDSMPAGGRLTISARNQSLDLDAARTHGGCMPGDYAALEVSDTGNGMPPEILARVFEPFFTTKETGKGTGLGLSMVFGFMKQSGGHVSIYSEVGEGTTVRLLFPRADAVDSEQDAGPAAPMRNGSETILAVEDNHALRRVLLKQLAELGYHVLEADHAAAALDILQGPQRIDLLLTDIVMPGGMNGWELARAAADLRPELKTLFASGFPDADSGVRGRVPDNARLLRKPYRKNELAETIRDVLAA